MAYSLLSCLTPALNISKKIFPFSSRFRNDVNLWKAVEVRFITGVTEDSAHTDKRDLSVFNVDSSSRHNENYESRLLKIAIIGVPNVGKSTVINQLVGRKVCSISSKVHTTRCKARAIGIHGSTQLVFLDTPGLVNSDELHRHHLEHSFHSDSEMAMLEADVIGVVHDVSNTWTRDRLDPKVLRLLYLYPMKRSFLILNKIDAVKTKRKLLDVVRLLTNNSLAGQSKNSGREPASVIDYAECVGHQIADMSHNHPVRDEVNSDKLSELQIHRKVLNERGWPHFREVFMVSALLGDGMNDVKVLTVASIKIAAFWDTVPCSVIEVDQRFTGVYCLHHQDETTWYYISECCNLQDYLLHISEFSSWLYPVSKFTDQPSETIIINTVRSKLLDHLPQEVPYNLTTAIEYFDIGKEGTISAVVLVVCPSLRLQRLVVGSRGLRIREIAYEAEQELQSAFRQPVRLKVVVTDNSQTPPVSPKGKFS